MMGEGKGVGAGGGGGVESNEEGGSEEGEGEEGIPWLLDCAAVLTGRPGEGGLCSQLKENRHQETEVQDVGCHFAPNSARTGAGKKTCVVGMTFLCL